MLFWKNYSYGFTLTLIVLQVIMRLYAVPSWNFYHVANAAIILFAVGSAIWFFYKDQAEIRKLRQDNADLIHDNVRLLIISSEKSTNG